jgi:hypothetical protein
MTPMPGARILRVNAFGTAAFVITAIGGAVQPGFLRTLAALIALFLFTVGCAVFLWALLQAFQRSRTDNIGMGGLFFLLAPTAPGVVRRPFMALLALQTAVGLGTAIATFGVKPFTPLAFGVMVPVFGMGLAGLWAARYGQFGPRVAEGPRKAPANRTE